MSGALAPLPLERLLTWIRRERATHGTVFGLHEDLFRDDLRGRPYALRRRGQVLESPVGVAAGPHTQLSQNLVAAWLCGARHLELKTVQVRDDLQIPRPCIDMTDEGYNCEWSQELPIAVSADQYLDAWVAIRLLQRAAGALDPAAPGFVMDLSVGYDLAGVRSAKVQRFLDRLTVGSREEIAARLPRARRVWPGADDLPLPDRVADSVTLSTMHGCPPEEIEQIARFLLEDRGLHTTVKLNPTLLGAREVRGLLNDTLGFAAEVPDDAFADDLQWADAVDLVRALTGVAARCGRAFAVKLTNTLACRNTRGVLPDTASMAYLSGRALHPLAVRAAARLQDAFDGGLDVSFAGGADARNVVPLAAAGLAPVTACSDLLRPGGYQRLHQYLDTLDAALAAAAAADLDQLAMATAGGRHQHPHAAALANLRAHDGRVARDPRYHRDAYPDRTIATDRPLGPFDCIAAPCTHTCPTGQDVAEYMHHTARGDLDAALAAVLRDNPLPTVTGMVCDHPCVQRCTRVNYEAPVRIRDVKRTVAHAAAEPPAPAPAVDTGRRVAVVGAGPAGLACAWHLALAGVRTTVYEAKGFAGGMLADAIPAFRLTDDDIARDLRRLEALGVVLQLGERIDRSSLDTLRTDHDAVLLAIGAQADRPLGIPGEDHDGVWPALRFLAASRRGAPPALGREVVVIGGGNTAMDAARTAVRLVEPGGRVRLVYRRTRAEMPAAREELQAIAAEGVEIRELLAPVEVRRHDDGLALVCRRMRLGAADASGRPAPEPVPNVVETLACHAVIAAVGQLVRGDLLPARAAPGDAATPLSDLPGVYVAGDALHGPRTLVEAMGDGRRAARAMLAELGLPERPAAPRAARDRDDAAWQDRAARLADPVSPPVRTTAGPADFGLVIGELTPGQAAAEAARCLDCAERCDVCVSVCPDRANVAFTTAPRRWPLVRIRPTAAGPVLESDGEFVLAQTRQTCNLVDLCNRCGNCATFCPTAGAPYRDKPRIALRRDTYAGDEGEAVHLLSRSDGAATIRRRVAGEEAEEALTRDGDAFVYETPSVRVTLDAATFAVGAVEFRASRVEPVSLWRAAALAVLLDGLADHPAVLTEEA